MSPARGPAPRPRRAALHLRVAALAIALLPLAALTRCTRAARPTPAPPTDEQLAAQSWGGMLAHARGAALAGRHGEADSVLGAYRTRWPGTTGAADAAFWEGLVQADPANPRGSTREALARLDAYRAGGDAQPRLVEANVVRRLVAQADSLRTAIAYQRNAVSNATAGLVPRDSLRARDEELQRVRAELEQARAELERVRRRLAAPAGRLPR